MFGPQDELFMWDDFGHEAEQFGMQDAYYCIVDYADHKPFPRASIKVFGIWGYAAAEEILKHRPPGEDSMICLESELEPLEG